MAPSDIQNTSFHPNLIRLGFKRGNPFETMEAEQERSILDELFVDIDNFERIRVARTVIVHAPRGCGKSAARVRLTNSLAPWTDRADMDHYALEFIHFEDLLARFVARHELSTEQYVDVILHNGAQSLYRFLLAAETPNPRLEALSITGQVKLGRLLWGFSPELLFPENVYELFSRLIPQARIAWPSFRKAVVERQVGSYLGVQSLAANLPASVLAFLIDMEPEDRQWSPDNHSERLELLVDLLQRLGYRSLTIMVDRVDEIQSTANHPETQAALLEPLLANLPLMEMPGISFKFFIPTATRDALLASKSIRTDRLDIVETTVDWSENRLRQLLAKRLAYFSGLPDFSMNTSTRHEDWPDGDERLSEAIEREMIALAAHSPRRLIRAGQLLINAYLARPNADLLTWADWLAARHELMDDENASERPVSTAGDLPEVVKITQAQKKKPSQPGISLPNLPLLSISRKRPIMRLNGCEISLAETEKKIIYALLDHAGAIEEEDLVDIVWNKAISTSGIDVALKRIRDEIDKILGEKKTGLKYYLMKKAGTVMLAHYEVNEEISS